MKMEGTMKETIGEVKISLRQLEDRIVGIGNTLLAILREVNH